MRLTACLKMTLLRNIHSAMHVHIYICVSASYSLSFLQSMKVIKLSLSLINVDTNGNKIVQLRNMNTLF